jgi:serine/threonine-protein kinase
MSERSDAVADLLAGLEAARYEPEEVRAARAWPFVARSYGLAEGYAVVDYALEHGLIRSPDEAGKGRHGRGRQTCVWLNPVDGSQMVWIPGGPFLVGVKKARAECKGFSLARHPVTGAQFKRFLEATGYAPPEDDPTREYFLADWTGGAPPAGFETHPVVHVSLFDALAYCRWAGLALPTEWLWEKAARGPDGRPYPWGEEPPAPEEPLLANVRSEGTTPVGRFARTRTAYGCEDMVGNVSEWCQPGKADNPPSSAAGRRSRWRRHRNEPGKDDEPGNIPQTWPDLPATLNVYAPVRGSCFLRRDVKRMAVWHRRRLGVIRRNPWVSFRPACLLPCVPAYADTPRELPVVSRGKAAPASRPPAADAGDEIPF